MNDEWLYRGIACTSIVDCFAGLGGHENGATLNIRCHTRTFSLTFSGVTIFRTQGTQVHGECAAKITMLALLNGAHPLIKFNIPVYMLWQMWPNSVFHWHCNVEIWKEVKTLLPTG